MCHIKSNIYYVNIDVIYMIYIIYIHIQRIKCFAERHSLLLFHAVLISIQQKWFLKDAATLWSMAKYSKRE